MNNINIQQSLIVYFFICIAAIIRPLFGSVDKILKQNLFTNSYLPFFLADAIFMLANQRRKSADKRGFVSKKNTCCFIFRKSKRSYKVSNYNQFRLQFDDLVWVT